MIFSKHGLDKEQFPALTGIRAVAAFMVFFHHLPFDFGIDAFTGLQLSFYSGVTLFFVLSGFLISYRYYGKIEYSLSFLGIYFVNRFARIYPVYFLVLTIVILVNKNFDPVLLLQNYTLTQNLPFLFHSHGSAISPSWSLTVEECFYILAPLIFFLCRKFNLLVPFLLMLSVLILIVYTYGNGNWFSNTVTAMILSSFFGHVVTFFSGIYLALLILKRKPQKSTESKSYWTLAGILGIALVFIALIYLTDKENSIKYPGMVIFNNLVLPIPVTIFYYGLCFERSWCRRFLSFNFMKLFGRSSYAFYLIHFPLIHYLAQPFIQPLFGNYNLYVFTIFIITVLVSVGIYLFYEHPMNVLIRRRSDFS